MAEGFTTRCYGTHPAWVLRRGWLTLILKVGFADSKGGGRHFKWRAQNMERLRGAVLCGLCRICK